MLQLKTFALIVFVCSFASQISADKFVTGKINHSGPKELAKNAKVQVELRDISLMDVASKLISSATITDATSFPISYKVKYNPSSITAGHRYSISVRITGSDGKLLYISDVQNTADVASANAPIVDVSVKRSGESSPDTSPKTGKKACGPACRGKAKACVYGYQKKDGCDICKCNDPCNPGGKAVMCGPKQRCFVDKKADGTFGTHCGDATSKKDKHDGASSKKDRHEDGSPKKDKHEGASPKQTCTEPKSPGHCRASLSRFHYNSATKMCETFTYGGCGGNGNNYPTKMACEKACKA